MAYKIEVNENIQRSMRKLDKQAARQIAAKLREVAALEDPRSTGKALTGNLSGLWRYRAGDYRILCEIRDDRLVVIVVDIGHRSKVYKRR